MKSCVLVAKRFLGLGAEWALNLPRLVKRCAVLVVDISLCGLAVWIALYLRLDQFVVPSRVILPSLISVMIAVPVFMANGLYRVVFRYSGWPAVKAVIVATGVYASFYAPIIMISSLEGVPRTIGIIQPAVLFLFITLSRLAAGFWLGGRYISRLEHSAVSRVLIYGAGSAGRQLEIALRGVREIKVLGFVDDDKTLKNRILNGKKIYSGDSLEHVIQRYDVTHVFLAIPSVARIRRHQILETLRGHQIAVRTLPSLLDFIGGRISLSSLSDLDVEDLLGREPIAPDPVLLHGTIQAKTVLVTGAGGSIGSELCKQIIFLKPTTLVLLEFSEYALYSVCDELERLAAITPELAVSNVVPVLCSVQDRDQLDFLFSTWRPDTVYHAAAFKHVPLVEENVVEAVKNNVIGTLNVVKLAIKNQVDTFILVSTDKAVRPTNVMGATKRLAEMVLQALNNDCGQDIRLGMVRFGNVLASSGSVIPKFQSQIEGRCPVTVTHPDVTRYFMTISEAAELVLQAATLARGGDVFLLDMGPPVKIIDLAQRMIALSGLSVKTDENPLGDIEIQFTGLRQGEKLFEELLISSRSQATSHPRIMRGEETFVPWSDLSVELTKLEHLCKANDVEGVLAILGRMVVGFPGPQERQMAG